jgi:hypothetical protein
MIVVVLSGLSLRVERHERRKTMRRWAAALAALTTAITLTAAGVGVKRAPPPKPSAQTSPTTWVTRPESWDALMSNEGVLWRPVPRMDMLVIHVFDAASGRTVYRAVADARGQPLLGAKPIVNVVDKATEHLPWAERALDVRPPQDDPAPSEWLQLN